MLMSGWLVERYRAIASRCSIGSRSFGFSTYIEQWSMWLDLKIILRAVKLLVYDPAAY
jgi:hypothetical protein